VQAGGGISLQHDPRGGIVFALLPRLGYVVHEFTAIVPGSVEIVAQPTYLAVFQGDTAHVGGLAFLAKYNFRTGTAWTPYVEGGAGVSYASTDVPRFGSQFNFILEAGVGIQYALSDRHTVNLGWLYHHLSNANTHPPNPSFNSGLFLLGFSMLY
jgi:opacity protein-like surface antigen